MKFLTIAIFIFNALGSFGQDTTHINVSPENNRLLIGVNVSADYCYRTLQNNNGSTISSWLIDLHNNREIPKFSYTTGLNICYTISKLTGIEIGLQYSNKGFATEISDLTFGDMIDPRYGFVYTTQTPSTSTSQPVKVTFRYNYHYLDVPVRAIFSFGKKRIHIVTSIGVTTNILIKATSTGIMEYENGDTECKTQDQPYNYNTINISPTISIGAGYKASNKINLRLEPTFRYGLLDIIDSPISTKLWNCGLNFTSYYSLK